jgi:hypothetical protein
MGREIRKVPKGWHHPRKENGDYQPMYDEYYGDAIETWIKEHYLWLEGKHPNQLENPEHYKNYKWYAEYAGSGPDIEFYRQVKWTEEEANCFQIYQTVSEGSPVSPVFETLEEMEKWLIKEGHSEKAAKAFCSSGWAPSMIMYGGNLASGIDSFDLIP